MSQAVSNQSSRRSAWSYLSRIAPKRTQCLATIVAAAVLAGCASVARVEPVIVRPSFPCTANITKTGASAELTQLPLQIELDAREQLPPEARAVGFCWYLQQDGKLFADQGNSGFLFRKRLTRWVGPTAWSP